MLDTTSRRNCGAASSRSCSADSRPSPRRRGRFPPHPSPRGRWTRCPWARGGGVRGDQVRVAAAEIVIPDPTTVTHMSGAGIHRFEEVVSRGNARFRREAGVAHADVDDGGPRVRAHRLQEQLQLLFPVPERDPCSESECPFSEALPARVIRLAHVHLVPDASRTRPLGRDSVSPRCPPDPFSGVEPRGGR
jgi:hypothetical protein